MFFFCIIDVIGKANLMPIDRFEFVFSGKRYKSLKEASRKLGISECSINKWYHAGVTCFCELSPDSVYFNDCGHLEAFKSRNRIDVNKYFEAYQFWVSNQDLSKAEVARIYELNLNNFYAYIRQQRFRFID